MTDDSDFVARRDAAYAKLDEAVQMLSEVFFDAESETPEMAIDAVLIIGSQGFDDEGHRTGSVTICPRGGWQPGYITSGLLHQALTYVDGTAVSLIGRDDD